MCVTVTRTARTVSSFFVQDSFKGRSQSFIPVRVVHRLFLHAPPCIIDSFATSRYGISSLANEFSTRRIHPHFSSCTPHLGRHDVQAGQQLLQLVLALSLVLIVALNTHFIRYWERALAHNATPTRTDYFTWRARWGSTEHVCCSNRVTLMLSSSFKIDA